MTDFFPIPSPRERIQAQPGIYALVNRINNRKYIGQSEDVRKRKRAHLTLLKRGNHPNVDLQNDYNAFSEKAFYFVVVEYTFPNELNDRERYWIDKVRPEYNCECNAAKKTGDLAEPDTDRGVSALKPTQGQAHMAKQPDGTHRESTTPCGLLIEKHYVMSWGKLGVVLGFNKGLLSAIAAGKRRAPNALIRKLNKVYGLNLPMNPMLAPVCPKCNIVHISKRCPRKSAFDEHAAKYDVWRSKNMSRLGAIVSWAIQTQIDSCST